MIAVVVKGGKWRGSRNLLEIKSIGKFLEFSLSETEKPGLNLS